MRVALEDIENYGNLTDSRSRTMHAACRGIGPQNKVIPSDPSDASATDSCRELTERQLRLTEVPTAALASQVAQSNTYPLAS